MTRTRGRTRARVEEAEAVAELEEIDEDIETDPELEDADLAKAEKLKAKVEAMDAPKGKKGAPAKKAGRMRDGKKKPAFKKLLALVEQSEKEFGAEYVMVGSKVAKSDTYIETGISTLDLALVGGIPENKVTTFVGWEGSGKTTEALKVVAAAQRKYPEKAAAWIDAEHTLDVNWGEKQGVDLDRMFVADPTKAEMVVDLVQGFMATGEVSIIVVDSLPAMVPKKVAEESAFDRQVAERSRLIGTMCSKVLEGIADAKAQRRKVTVIFINQWRSIIGGTGKGPTKVMPGGHQPRYLSSVIVDFFSRDQQGNSEEDTMKLVQHNTMGFKVRKSKLGNSLRDGEWDMIRDPEHHLGEGHVDDYLATLTYSKRMGLFNGTGTKQKFEPVVGVDKVFGNKDQAIRWLEQNPDDYTRVKRATVAEWRRRLNLPPIPVDGYLMGQWD